MNRNTIAKAALKNLGIPVKASWTVKLTALAEQADYWLTQCTADRFCAARSNASAYIEDIEDVVREFRADIENVAVWDSKVTALNAAFVRAAEK
jgi:hypothetical protein